MSEQINPAELEKKFQEVDMKLIKASERGNDKEAEKILKEKIDLGKESQLLAEAEELNKKIFLN